MELELTQLDLSKIPISSRICIIGMRNTGKTTMLINILKNISPNANGVIIGSSCYDKLEQPKVCYKYYESEVIEQIQKDKNKYSYIAIDDCIYTQEYRDDPFIKDLFINKKAYNIPILFTCSFITSISKDIRKMFDYVILLRNNMQLSRKRIYDIFGVPIFADFNQFNYVMNKYTEYYSKVILHCSSKNDTIYDKVYYYNC